MANINQSQYTAVICAAGQGKRLGSLAADIPKTLLKVGEKTILEYLLDNFSDCGLLDVIIVVGYKGDKIEQKIGNKYKNCSITYIYNKDYEITDNFYSLYLAKEKISRGMIFFNADVIFNKSILNEIISDRYENSLAVVSVDSPGAVKNPVRIKTDERGRLGDIGHDIGEQNRQMVFGIYKLSAEATAEYFKLAGDFFKNGHCKGGFWFPLKQMVSTTDFHLVHVDDTKWVSMNNPEEYENAVNLVGSILGKL
ncbi:phosphocholine cytidylyltransferase family protein [Candidatus Wolfebacteria bacterium]|nr:phosphocholine cytidylyltransferase family protein [Candidatus Wolfebacteria bacterium]